MLRRAGLIQAARRGEWARLPEMLQYITGSDRDEIYTASLLRLIRSCDDPRKVPVILEALKDPSPLVRAAAVEGLGGEMGDRLVPALAAAVQDEYRLVRVRAGSVLARVAPRGDSGYSAAPWDAALEEYLSSLQARPDDYGSLYNLGNYYLEGGDLPRAVESLEKALHFEPKFVMALVNCAMAYNGLGRNEEAERYLRRALELEPESLPANLNLGLLLAESGQQAEAQVAFRKVLAIDPRSAVAAHSLGVLLAQDRPEESIQMCRQAYEIRPSGRYGYTLAFYLRSGGDLPGAAAVLREIIDREPTFGDAYIMLAEIYRQEGRFEEAAAVMRRIKQK
ncbi:MAG: tetratricopeptide repeat protein [Acidobacteria bacterium]|nr:tetratricopeptide repeat protein [Acidobacteriota bacterium]